MSYYPTVLSERDTLAAMHAGKSVARFGDGELKLATGVASISQKHSKELERELRDIAGGMLPNVLTAIPNIKATPRAAFWREFTSSRYTSLYTLQVRYGSSFITRPDNAPWIDRPDYWQEVRRLWRNKCVAYVGGQDVLANVIREDTQVHHFNAPKRDAYAELDRLTRELLSRPYGLVVIAAGAAGTVLASRLGRDGAQHALDLGHIGMFMQNPGAFSLDPQDLATDDYRALLRHSHATTNWGRGGASWADKIAKFAKCLDAADVLDYGCGGGTLKPALKERGVKCLEYDPGVIGKDIMPKLADVVSSTDVFEHIEPALIPNVLQHTHALARKGAFFVIAKQPAKKILADGRNAHLSCHDTKWWLERLVEAGWDRSKIRVVEDAWKKVVLELLK